MLARPFRATLAAAGVAVSLLAGASSAQTVLTLAPTADTYVQDINATKNFGTSDTLLFGRGSGFGLGLIRTLLRFDLAALPSSNVKQATFSAFQYDTQPAAGTIDCGVRACTADWTETGATWSQQPAYDPKVWATAGVGDGPWGWVNWDVTQLARQQASGALANFGWLFRVGSETAGISRLGYFHSREYDDPSLRPKLVVTLYDLDLAAGALQAGQPLHLSVDRANPNSAVTLLVDLSGPGLTPIVRLGVVVELHNPQPLAVLVADPMGHAQGDVPLPAAAQGMHFWIQAAQPKKLSNRLDLVAP